MGIFKKFNIKTRNLIIAGAIAAAAVIAVPAFLISGTFAGGTDITMTFPAANSSYTQIAVNETINGAAGSKFAISSDTAMLKTDVTVQPTLLTGMAPGVASVAYMTATGGGRNVTFQVYDPEGIAGCRIPGGEIDIDKAGNTPVLIDVKLRIDAGGNGNITERDLTDWNSDNPNNKVKWTSLQPSVARIDDQSSGYFTAADKGSAILYGSVTDKWGKTQFIPVLVVVASAGSGGSDTPTVTGVTISPGPEIDAAVGSSTQFHAVVTGTNDPSQSVTWSISGKTSPDTGISGNGLLVISPNETGPTLTITAVSQLDPAITASVTVNIETGSGSITDTPVGASGRVLNNNKTGDGTWIEIARNGGYSLIVRAAFINVNQGHSGDPAFQFVPYGQTNDYGSSIVRTDINNWFNRSTSGSIDSLGANAGLRQFTVQNNAGSVLGSGSEASGGLSNGFSKPTDIKISSGSDDVAFALSYCECANFLSDYYVLTAGGGYADSSPIAVSNYGKLTIPQIWCYGMWLRSPGDNQDYQTAGALDYTGHAYQFHITHENEHGLIYPALWVDSAIFN